MAENTKDAAAAETKATETKAAETKTAEPQAAGKKPAGEKAEIPHKGGAKKTAQSSAKAAEAPKEERAAEAPKAEEAAEPQVRTAVLEGANPNVEFYRISDDLPFYLL